MVVHHQRLAGLARPGAELVQVLGVRDPLRLGGEVRRAAAPEVLEPQDLVLGQDLVEVDGCGRRPHVHVPGRGLEPVLVQQRAVLLGGQAAERERLDVAIAGLRQELEDVSRPLDRRCVGAEADVLGERHRWTEILFAGTPRPAQSPAVCGFFFGAAVAAPVAANVRHAATSTHTDHLSTFIRVSSQSCRHWAGGFPFPTRRLTNNAGAKTGMVSILTIAPHTDH